MLDRDAARRIAGIKPKRGEGLDGQLDFVIVKRAVVSDGEADATFDVEAWFGSGAELDDAIAAGDALHTQLHHEGAVGIRGQVAGAQPRVFTGGLDE
jgi:hypothetical protein